MTLEDAFKIDAQDNSKKTKAKNTIIAYQRSIDGLNYFLDN